MNDPDAAALRAALNEELGFYPANLDEKSIAEYRRKDAEYREWYAGYLARYGPNGSHRNQFRHLRRRDSGDPRP